MCEPTHSIVQYPDQDPDSGNSTGGIIESITSKVDSWVKRVKGWFHISKLGRGHSGVIDASARQLELAERILPRPTFYESFWWDRTVKFDGFHSFEGREYDKDLALDAATEYSKKVVIGDLGLLRRFLEVSMVNSDHPQLYVDAVLQYLVKREKRDEVVNRLKQINYIKRIPNRLMAVKLDNLVDGRVIKIILGVTRKRDWLIAAWADDDRLWTPGQSVGRLASMQ
jgi:hypothetical protein